LYGKKLMKKGHAPGFPGAWIFGLISCHHGSNIIVRIGDEFDIEILHQHI
jgi:hypothetical protein